MTQYAHIIFKDSDIVAIHMNDSIDDGDNLIPCHVGATSCTTIEHDESTITYEMVDGNIKAVTPQDIIDRMNDQNDTSVTLPTLPGS